MAELRETAQKVRIAQILDSRDKISRVNILATIINSASNYPSYSQTSVDDGSGKINIKNFENPDFFKGIDIGDIVMIIGKPREYNGERYIVGEIIKKIQDPGWLKVRDLELKSKIESIEEENETIPEQQTKEKNHDDILNIISDLDAGEGVGFDYLVSEHNINPNSIRYLLEKGEIFFVKPGVLKILE